MKKISKILYPTDFSANSVPAAEYARTLAHLAGATVYAVHVVGELADHRRRMIQPESFAIFEREVETMAVREMESFCRRHLGEHLGEQISYETEVVIGTPYKTILERARELACDLIVMGSHGHSGIQEVIFGSTAQRIIRRAKIPVLTVPGP
ncbi:MAG: universal stress protein [Desulfurivibrio sp.]